MRHVWSLLAGIALAALTWLLLATGQHRLQLTIARGEPNGTFSTADLLGPVIILVVAGILLGLLGTLRWSPTGPLAAGLLLALPTGFLLIAPARALDVFSYGEPRRVLGQDLHPWLPLQNGTALVLGALLLVAVFNRHRWRPPLPLPRVRRRPAPPPSAEETAMSDEDIVRAAEELDQQTIADEPRKPGGPGEPGGPSGPGGSGGPDGPGKSGAPGAAPAESAPRAEPEPPAEPPSPAAPSRPSRARPPERAHRRRAR